MSTQRPLKFKIPEESDILQAVVDLKVHLETFEKNAALLVGRMSAKDVWELLQQLLIIARCILIHPHWSEGQENSQVVDTGDIDELHNAKLVKRRTNRPVLVHSMSETEQEWFDANLKAVSERLEKGFLSRKTPISKTSRTRSQADLFYQLRQMSKGNTRQRGQSRGNKRPKSHKQR